MVSRKHRQTSRALRESNLHATTILNTSTNRRSNQTQKLLEEYSGIRPEDQSAHVHAIREKAWAIRTYPCTALGVFLIPYVGLSPAYSTVLQRLKDGEIMVDVGCFIGGDFRQCVFDGAPSKNMIGFDIADHWDVGYELFRDRDKFDGKFVEADLMAVESSDELKALKGRVGIIHISQMLHQWDWKGQVEAAKKLVYFSKLGTLVIGFQIGSAEAKEVESKSLSAYKHWRHDPASLRRMWDVVGQETGTEWKVEGRVMEWETIGLDKVDVQFMEPGDAPVEFVVERVG
jgi:hypothetical protein